MVEDVIITHIPATANENHMSLQEVSGINLKEYYSNITQWLYKLKVLLITNVYPNKEIDFKSILREYEKLSIDLNKLKDSYKRATMKSEKMRIDDDIYDTEIRIKEIINLLEQ